MKKTFLIVFAIIIAGQAFAQRQVIDSSTDGKYIKVNNAKLWVVTVGTGDPLLVTRYKSRPTLGYPLCLGQVMFRSSSGYVQVLFRF